jgi:hypothetical protein
MAEIKLPYGDVGLASFEVGDSYKVVELFSGPSNTLQRDYNVAAGVALPAFSVVGVSGGNLVLAVSGTTQAIGVTTATVSTSASAQRVDVMLDGCFNPEALNWDASYSTDALKRAAFDGAPAPTSAIVRKFR